eukprot:SAG11_NODE_4979_length_1704_cov_2.172586_2_plen_103_part_01
MHSARLLQVRLVRASIPAIGELGAVRADCVRRGVLRLVFVFYSQRLVEALESKGISRNMRVVLRGVRNLRDGSAVLDFTKHARAHSVSLTAVEHTELLVRASP